MRGRTLVKERRSNIIPTSIPNCVGWYAADMIGTGGTQRPDGDPVDGWIDLSGQSNLLSASGAARPTYRWNKCNGLPMVEFDNDDYISRTGDPFSTGGGSCQVFVAAIWKITGRGVIGAFPDWHLFRDGQAFWRLTGGSCNVVNTAPPLNQPVVMSWRLDGSSAGRTSTNGRQTGETAAGSGLSACSSWCIGGENTSGGPPPSSYFHGFVGEAIFYNRELTNLERAGIEQYLMQKWL